MKPYKNRPKIIKGDSGIKASDVVWDLMPLQQFKWLPKSIQNIEVGKFIGGKPFKVYDTEIGRIKK